MDCGDSSHSSQENWNKPKETATSEDQPIEKAKPAMSKKELQKERNH